MALVLFRLSRILRELPIAIMRPKDLRFFTRRTYARDSVVRMFSEKSCVDSGLAPDELHLVSLLPEKTGPLLVLGMGGGREAVALAGMGFEVTGIDFEPEMIRKAHENAERRGVKLGGLVQDMAHLDVDAGRFSTVWMSSIMYSCLPGRKNRAAMAQRIARALKPGGVFVCQFRFEPHRRAIEPYERLRKWVSRLTLGNLRYEDGDMILAEREFIHAFRTPGEVEREVISAGFVAEHIRVDPQKQFGAIVFRKPESGPADAGKS